MISRCPVWEVVHCARAEHAPQAAAGKRILMMGLVWSSWVSDHLVLWAPWGQHPLRGYPLLLLPVQGKAGHIEALPGAGLPAGILRRRADDLHVVRLLAGHSVESEVNKRAARVAIGLGT